MTMIATVTVQINNGPETPGQLNITQDFIDVTPINGTKPDPSWEFVDDAGHFHAYDSKGNLPTLDMRSRHVECGLCDDGDCEGYDVYEWLCRICDELVEPRRVPDHSSKSVPGLKSWEVTMSTLQAIGVDQVTVRVRIDDRMYFGVARVRMYFGVARVTEETAVSPWGAHFEVTLIGTGPLGERRP